MSGKIVSVAPREIHDLIQRASQVKGCEASVAERIASRITFSEVYNEGGINSWLQIATGEAGALNETFRLSQVLDSVPSEDSSSFVWDPPISFAFLSEPLDLLRSHGFAWSCEPEAINGESLIECVRLTEEIPVDNSPPKKLTNAFSEGVKVSESDWKDLTDIAANFLLSEKILDNAESPVYE
ncbi:MAG: Uncharacterised protein [Acidimicrobiales bacterium AG-410-I20]|nr:MAG: Uncharacterised protein [Acidimicrobiales bacterium AG-410-I20]